VHRDVRVTDQHGTLNLDGEDALTANGREIGL
jgi:hypothetical protein